MVKKRRDRNRSEPRNEAPAVRSLDGIERSPLDHDSSSHQKGPEQAPNQSDRNRKKLKNLLGGLKNSLSKRALLRKNEQQQQNPDSIGENGHVELTTDNSNADSDQMIGTSVIKVTDPSLAGSDDENDMEDSDVQIDEAPPIGEILATDRSVVSDIPDIITELPIESTGLIYSPELFDVCFDDNKHPGTKEWLRVVRSCLEKFADTDYSPPVYKAIKKNLRGRRFLIQVSRTSPVSWREATKPEIIEFFGECFNEQKRLWKERGGDDFPSDVDDSLEESERQSEESLSLENIMKPKGFSSKRHSTYIQNKVEQQHQRPHPQNHLSAPILLGDVVTDRPSQQGSPRTKKASLVKNGTSDPRDRIEIDQQLKMAIAACAGAQDYARPFDDTEQLRRGIAAEQKLNMLLNLASVPNTDRLKRELEVLDDLSKRMRYASMAPLFVTLEEVEKHLTSYFQSLAGQANNLNGLTPSCYEQPTAESPMSPEQVQADNQQVELRQSFEGALANRNRSIPFITDSPVPKNCPSQQSPDTEKGKMSSGRTSDREASATSHEGSTNHEPNKAFANGSVGGIRKNGMGLRASEASADPSTGISYQDFEKASDVKSPSAVKPQSAPEPGTVISEPQSIPRSFSSNRLVPNVSTEESLSSAKPVGMKKEQDDTESADESAYDEDEGSYYDNRPDKDGDAQHEGAEAFSEHDSGGSHQRSVRHSEEGTDRDESQMSGDDSEHLQNFEFKSSDDQSEYSSVDRSIKDLDMSARSSENGETEEFHEEDFSEDFSEGESDSDTHNSDRDGKGMLREPPPSHHAPNAKFEQFFDRLQHFFEVRRKIEEQASLLDPSEKIKNLKVKRHSGGIMKKNGKYKKEYQQHDDRGKAVRSLDDLYKVAKQAEPALREVLDRMANEIKTLDKSAIVIAPLKPRDRAYHKAKEKYSDRKPGPCESWLYDIVRCSVACKSYKQLSEINKWLGKNAHIVNSKNRFESPAFNGYRDLIYHVSIPYQQELGHICEIQVHHKDFIVLDEQFGLRQYNDFFSSSFAVDRRPEEETLRDLAMLNKYGDIGGQLMTNLMKSKDPDQLELFAGICREKLDDFDRALELYRRLLMHQEENLGTENEHVAATYLNMGLVLGEMGETEESLSFLRKALAIKQSMNGLDDLSVAVTCSHIGHMLEKKGDYNGALVQYRKALQIRESRLGNDHILAVGSLQSIGNALKEKGDFNGAVAAYIEALDIQHAILGVSHPDVARTHSLIGRAFCLQGNFDRSMQEYQQALEIRETALGKTKPMAAESHTDVGVVLLQKGEYDVAEWRHRKALRIREATLGKDHEDCAVSFRELGMVLSQKGDYSGAIKELREAIRIREKTLGRDNTVTPSSYIDLGDVYSLMGKYDDALQEYRRAMVIRESVLGEKHPDTAVCYSRIGNVLNLKEKHSAALIEHKKAIPIFEDVLGKDHPRTATAYRYMADTLIAKGEKDKALVEFRKALAIQARVLAKDHPDTAVSCSSIGRLLMEKDDLVGALVAFRQTLAIYLGLCDKEHPLTATARIDVGRVLVGQEELDDALEEFLQAETIRESSLGKNHVATAEAYSHVGSVLSMLGRFEDAEEKHNLASSIFEANYGKKHPKTTASRKKAQLAANQMPEESL